MTTTEPPTAALSAACERVLHANWREGLRASDGTPFGYTSPSPGHYPWQWYWDSCFAAISWRRFDPARARTELTSLLAAQREDGFIGHTIFWNTPLAGVRRLTYNTVGAAPQMTASIQPPLLAWAWHIAVGDVTADPTVHAQLLAHHAWLQRNRDLDGDGLIWIVQPDESGLDASPQFDPVWRWRAADRPGFLPLVWRNRRVRYDARTVAARNWPLMAELVTNVLYSLARVTLGQESLTQALIDRAWDQRRGLFQSPVYGQPQRGLELPVTWAALAPLALPDLPDEIGHRIVREHLLDQREFWLPAGTPTVAANARSFQRGDRGPLGIHRYWRGPMWVNATWLLWLGLLRLGYQEQATALASRVAAAVGAHGLREYYDPYSGDGMGQRDFGFSTLVMELADPDPRASQSYL